MLGVIEDLLIGTPKSDRRLKRFEKKVLNKTKLMHDDIIAWAEKMSLKKIDEKELIFSTDPIVKQGYLLRKKIITEYKDKLKGTKIRMLIHYPGDEISIAGKSLFMNLAKGLSHIGIKVCLMPFTSNINNYLNKFKPNFFISSDDSSYLAKIEWDKLIKYKKKTNLKIGLTTTSNIKNSDRNLIKNRVNWGQKNGVDFYYSFWTKEYITSNYEYSPYFKNNYRIISVEFGANIFKYFLVPGIKKDLDYIFLGSSNRRKRPRYHLYFTEIFKNHYGFYDGPEWQISKNSTINFDRDKFIYSRAKVGLNLETENRINNANELNERTYTLAAMGIPQLIDNVRLLPKRFSENAFFIADSPKEYFQLFKFILNNPEEAQNRALLAQTETFERHTILHRAESFVQDLLSL